MKLTHFHQITERRNFGKETVNQQMDITVDYDHEDDSISNPVVEIIQDGKVICEISKLLDKAEGEPLLAMIEAIDWREIYSAQSINEGEDQYETKSLLKPVI